MMYSDLESLKRMNDLLFTAFTFSSNVWMFDKREKMINFFCDQVFENESCTAVVVSDKTGEHYRMDEDVMGCNYLKYHPKVFSIVNAKACGCKGVKHKYLLTLPITEGSSVYIFLKEADEEIIQILKDMVLVLSRAIRNLEMWIERELVLLRLKENLEQFQFLSDRLRNPLSVITGVLEIADEIDTRKGFEMIKTSARKIKEVLDQLSDAEIESKKIYECLSS